MREVSLALFATRNHGDAAHVTDVNGCSKQWLGMQIGIDGGSV
jgi:hypothetical protein